MPTAFLMWGREVINTVASRLEDVVPGARRGSESHLNGYEAIYVHFTDARVPQPLAVWLFAAEAGTPNNFDGQSDVIAVGLKRDANVELDPGRFRFRPLTPFSWRRHVDKRYEGFRWSRPAAGLPDDVQQAADEIAQRVLRTLRRSEAIAT